MPTWTVTFSDSSSEDISASQLKVSSGSLVFIELDGDEMSPIVERAIGSAQWRHCIIKTRTPRPAPPIVRKPPKTRNKRGRKPPK